MQDSKSYSSIRSQMGNKLCYVEDIYIFILCVCVEDLEKVSVLIRVGGFIKRI